jgi:membrane protease YdiL (CAAX protease family)
MIQIAAERTEPRRDARRLALYFGGLIAVYGLALFAFWNTPARDGMFVAVMFAPTAGALLARYLGPGIIQWGRPSWWIVAGLLPAVAALAAYFVGAILGADTLNSQALLRALIASPIGILTACLTAVGEEIGWRGFLWPLARRRWSFLVSSLVIFVIWWFYHVPLILLGWYGTRSGLLAFTVAIAGFTLFVGVLTDRSRSLWPSVLAHGAWNALVSTGFAAIALNGSETAAFAGSNIWVGEFGWLAAIASCALGIAATIWHMRVSDGVSASADRPSKGMEQGASR